VNEEAIRAIVREVLATHLTVPRVQPPDATAIPLAWHASHARHRVLSGEEAAGPCFIEPAVRCNHCGYCQSHGH
jgi:hypothetical protein